MIPTVILHRVESYIGKIQSFAGVSGGCINNGGIITTERGEFFIKFNDASRYPKMFSHEAKGLQLLRNSNSFYIPQVIGEDADENFQFLILEKIVSAAHSKDYWKQFGEKLALLHQRSSTSFGLPHDNYIGSLHQSNIQNENWIDFFITQRLEPQVRIASENGLINTALRNKFETLYTKLPQLIPVEKSSLLHGDLWSGNVLTNELGQPTLIDPAVYYGHREVDLAMTMLFGGFDKSYISYYNEVFPLQPYFPERVDLFNLYPLLVHVNLFGSSYLPQVLNNLNRYM